MFGALLLYKFICLQSLEQPEESQNDRKARTTGKPERPESRNHQKAKTTEKAGTTGVLAAPIYLRNKCYFLD